MTLTAPIAGRTALLFRWIGATAEFACGDSSDWAGTYNFSDAALGENVWSAATTANNTSPIPPGSYRTTESGGAGQANPAPVTSLAAVFAGMTRAEATGIWTLTISDYAGGDTGSVSAATLYVDDGIFGDGFEAGTSCLWSWTENPTGCST